MNNLICIPQVSSQLSLRTAFFPRGFAAELPPPGWEVPVKSRMQNMFRFSFYLFPLKLRRGDSFSSSQEGHKFRPFYLSAPSPIQLSLPSHRFLQIFQSLLLPFSTWEKVKLGKGGLNERVLTLPSSSFRFRPVQLSSQHKLYGGNIRLIFSSFTLSKD